METSDFTIIKYLQEDTKYMNIKLKLSSGNISIIFQSNDQDVIDYFINDPLPRIHVPGYKAKLVKNIRQKAGIIVFKHLYIPGSKAKINQQKNLIEFLSPSKIPPGQFVFALLPIFEKLYEKNNLLGLHASSVKIKNCSVLILGNTKAGKSTLAAKLHYDYDAEFLSDERILISTEPISIVQGTQLISLRSDVVNLGYLNRNKLKEFTTLGSKSTSKTYYKPKDKTRYPSEIKKILFIFPFFNNQGISTSLMSDFSLSYFLMENINETIRSCISLFVGDSIPFPSQDNQKLAEARAKKINKLLKTIPHQAYEVTGDINKIVQFILEKVNQ